MFIMSYQVSKSLPSQPYQQNQKHKKLAFVAYLSHLDFAKSFINAFLD